MTLTKKKILYLVTQAEWGGAQKYIYDLATNLSDNFDITVGCGSDGQSLELLQKLQQQNIKTVVFKHLKRAVCLPKDLLAVREISKFLKLNHFDILHLNSSKAGIIGAVAGKINKIPKIIYTAHGWVYLEQLSPFKQQLYLLIEKIANHLRHTTIVLSAKEKEIGIKNKTVKKDAVFVIPNGIDTEQMFFLSKDEAKQKINTSLLQKNIIIGTIANLYKTKGLDILIDSFKNISSQIPNSQLIIIGEGEERKNLETKISQNKLKEKIILTGTINDAYKYLKAFDIFILTSTKEGFPYSLLEAMAGGLPIIATKVGVIPEILKNKESGLLIEPNNQAQMQQALEKLINDKTLQENLSKQALEKVKNYNLKETIQQTSSLY